MREPASLSAPSTLRPVRRSSRPRSVGVSMGRDRTRPSDVEADVLVAQTEVGASVVPQAAELARRASARFIINNGAGRYARPRGYFDSVGTSGRRGDLTVLLPDLCFSWFESRKVSGYRYMFLHDSLPLSDVPILATRGRRLRGDLEDAERGGRQDTHCPERARTA